MTARSAPLEVHPILHPSGARTYVVVEPVSRDALVVDPVLESTSEVLKAVGSRKATLRHVVDTHLHGDHLSGAALLREKTGADVVMSVAADCRAVSRRVSEGDVLALGETGLLVRAAPGLSPEAIVLEAPGLVFTGDTLLVGTIGVPDAPGSDGTALYDTMQRIFDPLPEDTTVHPGHDDMGRSRTTIRAEKRGNRWLREKDRDVFLGRWASDPRPVDKTSAEMLAANRDGATASVPELAPVATVGQPASGRGPVVAPRGMGGLVPATGGRTGGLVPERLAGIFVAGGLVVVAGCALGFLVHPAFHLAAGLVGIGSVGVGLASAGRKPKQGAGLYYTGPVRRTPTR